MPEFTRDVTIVFNNGSGNDANSGAGPATPLSGTAASWSSLTFTLDGSPDLSGVSANDVIYVQTSTGRKFFSIASVNDGADTVTVNETIAGTTSGLTWSIGGKRQTLDHADSRLIGSADGTETWEIVLEDDQTVSTSGYPLNKSIKIRSDGTTIRKITQSSNTATLLCQGFGTWPELEYIKVANSSVTKTSSYGLQINQKQYVRARYCIFGDATHPPQDGIFGSSANARFIGHHCTIEDNNNIGVNSCPVWLDACEIINNGSIGIRSITENISLNNCVIADNASYGIECNARDIQLITNCVIANNVNGGIKAYITATTSTEIGTGIIANNSITGNGGGSGYGIQLGNEWWHLVIVNNNFGTGGTANTDGPTDFAGTGWNGKEVDPQYTNAGAGDYTNNGTNLKGVGTPQGAVIGAGHNSSKSYLDIGLQRQEGAGGSGGLLVSSFNLVDELTEF